MLERVLPQMILVLGQADDPGSWPDDNASADWGFYSRQSQITKITLLFVFASGNRLVGMAKSARQTGRFVNCGSYRAFVPDPLPPEIDWTPPPSVSIRSSLHPP